MKVKGSSRYESEKPDDRIPIVSPSDVPKISMGKIKTKKKGTKNFRYDPPDDFERAPPTGFDAITDDIVIHENVHSASTSNLHSMPPVTR